MHDDHEMNLAAGLDGFSSPLRSSVQSFRRSSFSLPFFFELNRRRTAVYEPVLALRLTIAANVRRAAEPMHRPSQRASLVPRVEGFEGQLNSRTNDFQWDPLLALDVYKCHHSRYDR